MSRNIKRTSSIELSLKDKKEINSSDTRISENPSVSTLLIYFITEILGTAMLLFFGCMGVCVPKLVEYPLAPHFGGIGFGLTVLTVIQAIGHISGAHLNPQVTLAAVILKVMNPICLPVYVTAQFIGACVGFGLLKAIIPLQYTDALCETVPDKNMSDLQAFAMETILTGCLILVCAAVWDSRNSHHTDSTPIRFGFIIACLSMAGGPFTGASMNSARTFAPVLINGNWMHNQWIYWLGPTLGAVIAALFYRYILGTQKPINLYLKFYFKNTN